MAQEQFTLIFKGTSEDWKSLFEDRDARLEDHINDIGDMMTALSDKVDQVLALEADEDAQAAAALAAKDAIIADLQAQVGDLSGQLTTALADDAADAQTIAETQAALDAAAADTQAQIDRLEAAFPTAVVEPPVDPDAPPVNGGDDVPGEEPVE